MLNSLFTTFCSESYMRREAQLWLKAGYEDLEDAKDALLRKRWFRAAFFAQQAVEKIFKALFFVVKREEPPKIRTITELYLSLKEQGFSLLNELEEKLYTLNKYYTVTRYPDAANGLPSESVDREEAERAVKIAEMMINECEKTLKRQ